MITNMWLQMIITNIWLPIYILLEIWSQAWFGARSSSCGTWVSRTMWATFYFQHFTIGFIWFHLVSIGLVLISLVLIGLFGFIWFQLKHWIQMVQQVSDMWNVVDFITNSLYVATIGLRLRAYYDVIIISYHHIIIYHLVIMSTK